MKAYLAAILFCGALTAPATAQVAVTGDGKTAPPRANTTVTGAVDAPKNASTAKTPAQLLPGEAQTTTSTDVDTAASVEPDKAKLKASPSEAASTTASSETNAQVATHTKTHHRHKAKTSIGAASDEPGAPPPH